MGSYILIVEDAKELAELVALYLTKEGFDTGSAGSAEDALSILETRVPDLIVLDINLPGMDGLEFLHKFRKNSDAPVLIVSARNSDEDIISALGYGADEFVTKPFSPKVLVARVKAILRRGSENQELNENRLFRFGPFTLDYDACILKKGDKKVPLSAKEFEVLSYLSEHAGKPTAPERIYEDVWKNVYGDLTSVAVYIQRIRKKIENDPGNPEYIETVHGIGYQLNPDSPAEVQF